MPANAAVAMWADVAFDAREAFNDWHAHEHMPERLSIPGFVRGSRWVAAGGGLGYFILYEVEELATLTTGPYLERLNNPTPWSKQMMPHHQNMVRSLCRVQARFGAGLGRALATIRFSPQPGAEQGLGRWLQEAVLPELPSRKGLVASLLLRDAASTAANPTMEQKIRGRDATADWAVLVSGYDADAVAATAVGEFSAANLARHGAAPGSIIGAYDLAFVLAN